MILKTVNLHFLRWIVWLGLLLPVTTHAQLEWRVSIKVFTNASGALPPNPVNNWNFPAGRTLLQYLSNDLALANSLLDAAGRGYRFRLTEIVPIAGTTAPLPASASSWFDVDVNSSTQDDLDSKAKEKPSDFALRTDAINFYITGLLNTQNGGSCAFPTEKQHVILVSMNSFNDVLIHEAGHFFSLYHTHNSEMDLDSMGNPCTTTSPCTSCAQLLGGDDTIADTPLDNQCWNQDQIALNKYGQVYAALTSPQQFFVDNTWSNIMSYHSLQVGTGLNRFTPDQMDRVTDASNSSRINVATGRTWFVSTTGNDSTGNASSTAPYRSLGQSALFANSGDIVLLRAGNYDERLTLAKRVTLRATRGSVIIGSP